MVKESKEGNQSWEPFHWRMYRRKETFQKDLLRAEVLTGLKGVLGASMGVEVGKSLVAPSAANVPASAWNMKPAGVVVQRSWDQRLKQSENPLGSCMGITRGVAEVSPRRIPRKVSCCARTRDSLHFPSTGPMALVQDSPRPLREAIVFTSPGVGEDSSYPEGWPRWCLWN